MKMLLKPLPLGMALALAATLSLHADSAPAGAVDFGKFDPPDDGGTFVEVAIGSNLINMAAVLAEKAEPQVAKMIRGVQQIRVNVIGLNEKNKAAVQARVAKIREQLDALKWERIVTACQQGQDVAVFVKTKGEEAVEGLAVTVVEGQNQAVLVNIVGNIRPADLVKLGERFNVDPLKHLGQQLEQK
jgi:hypothetical protein